MQLDPVEQKILTIRQRRFKMFVEATVAMLSVMFMLWGAAVWASYKEDPDERRPVSVEKRSFFSDLDRKAA